MSATGRYFVRDRKTGRLFCVEPISERNQKLDDRTWSRGGIMPVQGGAVREEDSIIREENGFRNIVHLPPGTSPDGYIAMLLQQTGE